MGYSWIDEEEFLFDQQISSTLFRDWGKHGTSQLSARVAYLDYLFPVGPDLAEPPNLPGVNEHDYRDRDGWGYGGTLQHAVPVGRESALYVGLRYVGFAADGKEYDFNGGELFSGVETLLPGQIALRGEAGIGYFPFANQSSYIDPPNVPGSFEGDDREDVAYRVRVELERGLGAGFSLLARYRYTNRMSNVDVFDYDRHVAGLYVTYSI